MDLPAPDLDDLADRDRLIATEVEDALEHEIGVQPGGVEGGGVTGLEGQGKQRTGIQGPVVVGITRKHEAMGKCFFLPGLRRGHARVPRIMKGEAGRW